MLAEKDLVDLTAAIAAMNAFNRMGVSFRLNPAAKHDDLVTQHANAMLQRGP